MTVTWHSFDLKSGRRGQQVHVETLGKFKRLIGESTDALLEVRCYDAAREKSPFGPTDAGAISGWDEATLPGRTMLVALDDNESILWGGMVLRRTSDLTAETVQVSVHTLEHYLERRYVEEIAYFDADLAVVVAGLIGEQAVDGLDIVIDAPNTGAVVEELAYDGDEDKTIASALESVVSSEGPAEWTVDLSWADAEHTRLVRTVRAGLRLGKALPLTTMWQMPGPVIGGDFVEDYSPEEGANDVLAVSSGEGAERPTSSRHIDTGLITGGWARFERRFTPGTNITDDVALDRHAETELQATKDGLNQLTVVAQLDGAPRLGIDWWLGDDITVSLTCPRFPAHRGPDGDMVPGLVRRLRAVGVEIDLDARTIAPITREIEER